ncbi:choice-of-anchor F family protein [Hoeflea sp. J2-29]|uniref:Choice-of-anchor F family protein n=2 Tax=Hoeflea ulvae TaxID=2983764 RepID=A0ABT3YFY4_9HYPH|nr:choice-of-anchor F family protein [Hoeflea ulvae]
MRHFTATVAQLALLLGASFPATSAEILNFDGPTGDGFVFSDVTEDVSPPGIKAVTVNPNNDDRLSGNGFSPSSGGSVTVLDYNCLMANSPITCDAEPGLGKRFKSRLTGPGVLDLSFSTGPSGGTTEYFAFGKTTNLTGARILDLSLVLGTGSGTNFQTATSASGISYDQLVALQPKATEWLTDAGILTAYQNYDGFTDANGTVYKTVDGAVTVGQNPTQRIFFPDGLFGDGGQESDIAFFNDKSAGFIAIQSADGSVVNGIELFNTYHIANFGNGLLSLNMAPTGMFWDDNNDPTDESALIAWNSPAAGGWIYGNVASTANLDARLEQLAAALGVAKADLAYSDGGAVPANIVALMEADGLFEAGTIEDLANLNLNFSLDVSDLVGEGFTLRIVPVYAPIVQAAGTPMQFAVAGAIDAANIPYLAADPGHQAMITQVMALPTRAQQQNAIEELGYSFLRTYMATGLATGREQVATLNSLGSIGDGPQGSTWSMTDTLSGFLSANGTVSSFDRTTNNIGFDLTSGSLWAGIESEVSSEFSLGALFGGFQTDATIDAGRGSLDSDGFGAGVFARGNNIWDHLNFQAMAGYQNLDFTSSRNVIPAGVTAQGETDADLWFGAITADWMTRFGAFEVGPTASLEYYDLSTKEFTETGAGIWNMTIGDQDDHVTIGRIGLKANYRVVTSSWDIGTYGHVAYAEQSGSAAVNSAKFAGLPQMSLPVDGLDSSSVDFGIGFKASPVSHDNLQFGVSYRGTVASNDTSNSVQVFAKVKF